MIGSAGAPVAIVGMGVKCAAGNSIDDLWATLTAGRPLPDVSSVELPGGFRTSAVRDDSFDPSQYFASNERRRMDRIHELGLAAARDAMTAAGTSSTPPERLGVVVGVGWGGMAFVEDQIEALMTKGASRVSPMAIAVAMPNSVAAHLALEHGARGPSFAVCTACTSGASAIGEGARLLRDGLADRVLAGGVDSLVTATALSLFWRTEAMSGGSEGTLGACRPFDLDRDGFVMGEGGGFVVLERLDDAQAAGRDVVATIIGYGATTDAHHIVAPCPDGDGARRCMELALDDAGLDPSAVGHVNAHGTGTRLNDAAEAEAVAAVFGASAVPVTSIKGATGHMIGGSGAVELIATALSARAGCVPMVHGLQKADPNLPIDVVADESRAVASRVGLTNSFGFGGHNATLVVRAS